MSALPSALTSVTRQRAHRLVLIRTLEQAEVRTQLEPCGLIPPGRSRDQRGRPAVASGSLESDVDEVAFAVAVQIGGNPAPFGVGGRLRDAVVNRPHGLSPAGWPARAG